MAIRNILHDGDELLLKKSKEVKAAHKERQNISSDELAKLLNISKQRVMDICIDLKFIDEPKNRVMIPKDKVKYIVTKLLDEKANLAVADSFRLTISSYDEKEKVQKKVSKSWFKRIFGN